MTPAQRPAKRTSDRAKTTPSSAKPAADQGKQPPGKRTESAPRAVKLVRKGRRPTAGAKLTREMSGKKDSFERTTLIAQAARLADRLEVIARFLDGDPGAWQAVKITGQATIATVVVTDVVREERQLSEVLRKLLADILKLGDAGPADPAGPNQNRLAELVATHYGKKERT